MESLIKNNHCGLYKINPDYFLCRFHDCKFDVNIHHIYINAKFFLIRMQN